jgi:hypothetical protein
MVMTRTGLVRMGVGLVLATGGLACLAMPEAAPGWAALGLLTTFGPLVRAWRGARGTALRPALAWGCLAVSLAFVAEAIGGMEAWESGRPVMGHWVYVSTLATLASLISVLNARWPGGQAWALLMGLLVVVLLIPWLEAPGRVREAQGLGRLRLDAPWSLFYGLLVLAGVTNYLPTRYGPAAAALAVGFALEYLGLSHGDWDRATRGRIWPAVPWTIALSGWLADILSRRTPHAPDALGASWLWFRDHWGVVWALRVQERFNRVADASRWPIRLGWYGIVPAGPTSRSTEAAPPAAETTFQGLIRRFVTPGRIEQAARTGRAATPASRE